MGGLQHFWEQGDLITRGVAVLDALADMIERAGLKVEDSGYSFAGHGTLTLRQDGSFTFIPVKDYDGTIPPITYTIDDGQGGTDSATLTLGPDIIDVNDAPDAVDPRPGGRGVVVEGPADVRNALPRHGARRLVERRVAPRVHPTVRPTRGELELHLARQPLAQHLAVLAGLRPHHAVDRVAPAILRAEVT